MDENLVLVGFIAIVIAAMLGPYWFFVRRKQHRCTSIPWWRLFLGNVLILLCAAAWALLLGEVYFRFWYDGTDGASVTKTSQAWFDRHWHLNQWGFRDDHEYVNVCQSGKRRITFIGDSFTAGQGIRNISDRFANHIRQTHPDWEVHVLAQRGWSSGDELEQLIKLAHSPYEFDQVVLVYVLNDIEDISPQFGEFEAKECERLGLSPSNFVLAHSYLLNTLYYRYRSSLTHSEESADPQHDSYFNAVWNAHVLRLKAMRDIVRDRGGDLAVVTFPDMEIGSDYSYRDVHRKLDKYWGSLGVPHLDLLSVYEPYALRKLIVNSYDYHPNEFANSLAADAVGAFLEAQPCLRGDKRRTSLASPGSLSYATEDEIIRCYRTLLDIHAKDSQTWYDFGVLLAKHGQHDAAVVCYCKAWILNPDSDDALRNLTMSLSRGRQFGDAIVEVQNALAHDPNSATLHNILGMLQVADRQIDEAISNFRKALAINPNYSEARRRLLEAIPQCKNLDAIVAIYREALAANPRSASAHNEFGIALAIHGQIDEAITHYRKALAIDPNFVGAHNNLGLALTKTGKIDEAIAHYRKALSIFPNSESVRDNLGDALADRGQIDEAAACWQKVLEINPENAHTCNKLGKSCFHRGYLDEALSLYRKALALNPQDADTSANIALTEEERAKLVKMLAQWRESLRTRPKDLKLTNNIAWMLATNPNSSIRNGKEALELAQHAVDLSDAKDPRALETLAAAYAEVGSFSEAVATGDKALQLAMRKKVPALVKSLRTEIELYKNKAPFRQAPTKPGSAKP